MPELGNFTQVLGPEIWLVLFALLVMTIDMFSDERPGMRASMSWVALGGVIITGLISMGAWNNPDLSYQGSAVSDHFAIGLNLIILTATGLGILLSTDYIPRISDKIGEFYALLLLCAVGMMMMGKATDLITVFLALEIFSLSLYILSGINRESPRSSESAMKYFLLGAFASSFFVYGAALIYGATGSTQYHAIAEALANSGGESSLMLPGMALLLVGFGFKVSMVPFHMWTPDVYQGAPTPVTAFMSVGTKAAAFAAFIRIVIVALPSQQPTLGWAIAGFAVVTMTLGNFAALRQTSLKRMLAYSSIAHAGYVLVGMAPGTLESASHALFYLFTYAFMNIGAFAVIIILEQADEGDVLHERATGLANRWPLLAAAMAIFMFSLSGIPPMAGFIGKLFVFKAAISGGWVTLAIIAMLNSVVGFVYYMRVVISMYLEEPTPATANSRQNWPALDIGLAITAILTILVGVFPGMWSGWFL
ncbi:MAG: NADH-quinone oxidoreductase subunit N [Chloroflexota bacterium]